MLGHFSQSLLSFKLLQATSRDVKTVYRVLHNSLHFLFQENTVWLCYQCSYMILCQSMQHELQSLLSSHTVYLSVVLTITVLCCQSSILMHNLGTIKHLSMWLHAQRPTYFALWFFLLTGHCWTTPQYLELWSHKIAACAHDLWTTQLPLTHNLFWDFGDYFGDRPCHLWVDFDHGASYSEN